jgi:hypothetical protein
MFRSQSREAENARSAFRRFGIGWFKLLPSSSQHFAVDDAARHTTQQLRMWDRVEVLRQIGVHDIGVAPAEKPVHFLDRVACSASGTIAIGTVLEVRLEDRFEQGAEPALV